MLDGLATKKAPPVSLPLRYVATGIVAYIILQTIVAVSPATFFSGQFTAPFFIGTVHLVTVGWVTMVIVGVMYQMVPVLLQVELHNERLGRTAFWPALAGTVLLVTGFWSWRQVLFITGGILAVAGFLFSAYVLLRTMLKAPRWNIQGYGMLGALAFLLFTFAWGLVMVFGLRYGYLDTSFRNFMFFHLLLGMLGWFSLMIFGVAYRLVPMFALAHGYSEARHGLSMILLGSGAAGTAVLALLGVARAWLAVPGLLVVAAFYLFGFEIANIIKHRRRRRLELVTRFSMASVVSGMVAVTIGWALLFTPVPVEPRVLTALAYLMLMGWVSLMVVGHLYKIIPFLAWLNRYGEKAGKESVPLLRDLYSRTAAEWSFRLLVAGLVVTVPAALAGAVELAGVFALLGAAGACLFGYAMLQVLLPRQERDRKAVTPHFREG